MLITNEIIDNVIKVIQFSEIKELEFWQKSVHNPDIWRWTSFGDLNSQKMFILKSNSGHHFYKIKKDLRKYFSKKNYSISENYLDSTVIDFLISCKISNLQNCDITINVKEWLEELDTINRNEYRVLLPINHFDYRNELSIANLKIVKINTDLINKYFVTDGHIPNTVFTAKDFIQSNDTDICAIINVKAHDDSAATELARELLDKFIFSIKLFDPGSFISTRQHSYQQTFECILVHNKSTKKFLFPGENYFMPSRIVPNEKFYKNLKIKWEKLASFLYSEHLTMFQKSILASMYWYGSIDNLRDSNVQKFLFYLIGLEKLLLKKNEQQKTKKFGEHAAILFSGNLQHCKFYESYYAKRNELIHDENIRIYDEEISTLRLNLRSLLLVMIENSDKYSNIESFYKDKYKLVL